MYQYFYII